MQGQVLLWDPLKRSGLIGGDDGQRYLFSSHGMLEPEAIASGVRVDFVIEAGMAREVFVLGRTASPGSYPKSIGSASSVEPDSWSSLTLPMDIGRRTRPGFWGYFLRALRLFKTFRGRASRREYWAFMLGSLLVQIAFFAGTYACVRGFLPYSFQEDLLWQICAVMWLLFWLSFLPASVSVTIRRLHDLGLTGWFYLLTMVPYLGWLFGFIVAVVPSKRETTEHGPPASIGMSASRNREFRS